MYSLFARKGNFLQCSLAVPQLINRNPLIPKDNPAGTVILTPI